MIRDFTYIDDIVEACALADSANPTQVLILIRRILQLVGHRTESSILEIPIQYLS